MREDMTHRFSDGLARASMLGCRDGRHPCLHFTLDCQTGRIPASNRTLRYVSILSICRQVAGYMVDVTPRCEHLRTKNAIYSLSSQLIVEQEPAE